MADHINDFVVAAREGRRPRIDADDALDVMRFVDGCLRSVESGEPVVFG